MELQGLASQNTLKEVKSTTWLGSGHKMTSSAYSQECQSLESSGVSSDLNQHKHNNSKTVRNSSIYLTIGSDPWAPGLRDGQIQSIKPELGSRSGDNAVNITGINDHLDIGLQKVLVHGQHASKQIGLN